MRQGWYKGQARRVRRAFAADYDNKARLARYQRRDGVLVNTATGEIVEPAPAGVREKVLAFALGDKKPQGAPSKAEFYGQRLARPISGYINELPKGRRLKSVLAVVALVACALITWRVATYTIPQLHAQEETRMAVIEAQQERFDHLNSLSPEEREHEGWQQYYESFD